MLSFSPQSCSSSSSSVAKVLSELAIKTGKVQHTFMSADATVDE